MSLHKISRSGGLARSVYNSTKGLLARKTLEEISVQAFYKRSFSKISVRELLARLLYKISTRALRTRSLRKLSIRDLLVKISVEDLLDNENEHRATTRAIRQAQCDERVARATWPRPPFRASLRSRNAHGHVTRAIFCGKLKRKYQTQWIPPQLNTGP